MTGSTSALRRIRFAAIGLNHDHIYMQVECIRLAGGELAGFYALEDDLAAEFVQAYPDVKRVETPAQLLEDQTIQLILTAAIPSERAAIGIAAMRHGKDVMSDKPGATSLAQLAEISYVQAETGRIFSIYYEERFENRSTARACELVRNGAIGDFVHSIGLGPHKLRKQSRPEWFFDRARYGGIITDLGSHQCDQFLYLSNTLDAEISFARIANRETSDTSNFQNIGEAQLSSPKAGGYFKVDWFTPDALPVFGDCRLMIVGTHGTIEVRKYIDVGCSDAEDHLILVDRQAVRRIDCQDMTLPYGRNLVQDVLDRTESAMTQAHCFKAMELALQAQELAEQLATG